MRRISIASLVAVCAIVLTGAAVRLTGSGLGCLDWPNCMKGQLTPPAQFHSVVEFGNRMVTIALVIVVGVNFLVALRRRPFRSDLLWLTGGLIAGVVAEAVAGGILIYTKLNPYVLVGHFLVTLLLVVDAAVLVHRSNRDYSPGTGRLLVPQPVLWLSRGVVVLLAIVLTAGAVTTGAAPDAGGATGQLVAQRIPMALQSVAELHSTLALLLVGVAVGLAFALHAIDVPERVRKGARMLVVVLALQAVVGYTQYFTHLPAALVEIHELGATILVVGVVAFFMTLTHHAPERVAARVGAASVTSGLVGAANERRLAGVATADDAATAST